MYCLIEETLIIVLSRNHCKHLLSKVVEEKTMSVTKYVMFDRNKHRPTDERHNSALKQVKRKTFQ